VTRQAKFTEFLAILALSCRMPSTPRAGVDRGCEKLSEFPVEIFSFAFRPFFLHLRFTVWVLDHARTNQLSTMLETTLG
jgi:hypothetical protein